MKNYYVTVILKQGTYTQEFSEIFGAKDDLTAQNDRAVKDASRYASFLIQRNPGTEFVHLTLRKAKIGVVKKDGSIKSGKGNLLFETDTLTIDPAIIPVTISSTVGNNLAVSSSVLIQGNISQSKITIDPTTSLNPDEIFVFGSNEAGMHMAGAAKMAMNFGAIYGQSSGLQGNTYAIPTKDTSARITISFDKVKEYIDQFNDFVKNHPEKKFIVTKIGCGYAHFTPEEIAPLFAELKDHDNVSFPQEFWDVLNN